MKKIERAPGLRGLFLPLRGAERPGLPSSSRPRLRASTITFCVWRSFRRKRRDVLSSQEETISALQ